MENLVRSYFDQETRIFYKIYTGVIKIDDVFESWEESIRISEIPAGTKRFLISYKDARISFASSKAHDIADFYKRNDHIFGISKIAMVMETPDQIVFPYLVEMEKVNFKVRSFYTMEAAIYWLMET